MHNTGGRTEVGDGQKPIKLPQTPLNLTPIKPNVGQESSGAGR